MEHESKYKMLKEKLDKLQIEHNVQGVKLSTSTLENKELRIFKDRVTPYMKELEEKEQLAKKDSEQKNN